MPLNVRSERLWGLCAERPAAGLRHRWVAAGTGLCHQLPTRTEDAWHSWIFHSQGASSFPSHGHHACEGMARPRDATPGWGHKRSPPPGPQPPHRVCRPLGSAGGRGRDGSKDGALLLLAIWGCGASHRRQSRIISTAGCWGSQHSLLSPSCSLSIVLHREPALADLVSASFPS